MDNDTSSLTVPNGRKLLEPSELGTKEYWEAAYTREISNNADDADDEGVIWFDESNAEDTVLKKLAEYAEQDLLSRKESTFLDLGTGNGHMLVALREDEDEEGARWMGTMVGVDYSANSVQLARQVDAQRRECLDGQADEYATIRFEEWDLLSQGPGGWLDEGGVDVVLDKGTFDAISLMPHTETAPHPCDGYRDKVAGLIKPGQYLFITSCNWTKDELIDWLAPKDGELELHDEAKYPTFTFGGQTGQSVVTAIFRRKSS